MALNTIGLGVDELEDGIEWTTVPNPSSDNISIHNLAGDLTSIKVIDTQGKVVKEENSGDSIDVSTLQAGVYYLRLVVDGKVEQRKFVRN